MNVWVTVHILEPKQRSLNSLPGKRVSETRRQHTFEALRRGGKTMGGSSRMEEETASAVHRSPVVYRRPGGGVGIAMNDPSDPDLHA
jgi:hypothetical protein